MSGIDLTAPFRLDGKVAVVTGTSYGLGVLFTEILASAGADVVITARSLDKLNDTKAMVESLGRQCLVVAGDVTSYDDCEHVAEQAMATFGRIDVLVNNAGWADGRLVRSEHCEPEMFAKMVNTDLVGLFYMTHTAAPHMFAAVAAASSTCRRSSATQAPRTARRATSRRRAE